eukprot:7385035-Prymnesium_polylepis.1
MGCGASAAAKAPLDDAPEQHDPLVKKTPDTVSITEQKDATQCKAAPPEAAVPPPEATGAAATSQSAPTPPHRQRSVAEALRAEGLRMRLAKLGAHASMEVSPAQALSKRKPGKFALLPGMDDAATSGERPPLAQGTRCFVNVRRLDSSHLAGPPIPARSLRADDPCAPMIPARR